MPDKPYRDRFQRLEIPEERRQLDWSFLDASLGLPRPVPLEDRALFVLVNGRVLLPAAHQAPTGPTLALYDLERELIPLGTVDAVEASWRAEHEAVLQRAVRRFVDSAPTAILREPALVREAIDLLSQGAQTDRDDLDADKALTASQDGDLPPVAPTSLLGRRIVGQGRFLRLHHKLYDLVTLREYTRIFERAIEPALFRALQELPDTAPPADFLARIAASLESVHAKARSPLRNKMATSRVVFNGVTLLPIYQGGAADLLSTYAVNLEVSLKVQALLPHTRES